MQERPTGKKNSLHFVCLIIFTSLSLLKDNFAGYIILGWWLYFLNTLNISLHSPFACVVSEEKPDRIFYICSYTGKLFLFYPTPSSATSSFFRIFSLPSIFSNLKEMCIGVRFGGIYPTSHSLSFLDLGLVSDVNLEKFSVTISNISSVSFSFLFLLVFPLHTLYLL